MNVHDGGIYKRLIAVVVDWIVIFIIISVVTSITNSLGSLNYYDYLIQIAYFIILPLIWGGYTIGKRLLGIRIVKKDGSNVNIITMTLRLIGVLLIVFPFYAGIFIAFDFTIENIQERIYTTIETQGIPIEILIGLLISIGLVIMNGWMVMTRDDGRTIHDLLAGTVIIRKEKK